MSATVRAAKECGCFQVMRDLSRQGFTVEVRSNADRLTPLTEQQFYGTCTDCAAVYVLSWTTVAEVLDTAPYPVGLVA